MIEVSKERKEELRDMLASRLDLPEWSGLAPDDIRVLLALIESAGVKHSGEQPAPLPKEVEDAMVTIHEAAYDGLCYKYHAKDKVEWWDAFLKAEALIKAALEKPAPPAEPCPGNLNCPTCLALERADDRKEKK